jgi:hypothetical protein
MSTPVHGQGLYDSHAFDWQRTATEAVIHYLENDFQGVFDREDLMIDCGKVVVHKTLHTDPFHNFEAVEEWTDERLDRADKAARSHFSRRAGKFREHLKTPGPYLYFNLSDHIPEPAQIVKMLDLLGHHREHRFHLLLMAPDAIGVDLSAFEGRVSAAVRSGDPNDVTRAWEWQQAYDGEWYEALSRFNLVRPRPDCPRCRRASPYPVAQASASARNTPGLLQRLMGRK